MSQLNARARVVITGMGIASPLGCGISVVWERLLAGESGLRKLNETAYADVSAKVAGVVPDISEDSYGGLNGDAVVSSKDQRKMDRFILLALVAAEEALQQAQWQPNTDEQQER